MDVSLLPPLSSLLQHNLLRGALGHQRTDHTGEEDHHHHTVQHVIIDEIHSWRHFQAHAHHHHGNGTGSMG